MGGLKPCRWPSVDSCFRTPTGRSGGRPSLAATACGRRRRTRWPRRSTPWPAHASPCMPAATSPISSSPRSTTMRSRAETIATMFAVIAENYELPRRILRLGPGCRARRRSRGMILRPRASRTPRRNWNGTRQWRWWTARSAPPIPPSRRISAPPWAGAGSNLKNDPNKRPGAFCTGSPVIREERIFMTFGGIMLDVTTLAHETGHAWHSHLLGGMRPCARDYPMTLAETASTFAELAARVRPAVPAGPAAGAAGVPARPGDRPGARLTC